MQYLSLFKFLAPDYSVTSTIYIYPRNSQQNGYKIPDILVLTAATKLHVEILFCAYIVGQVQKN